MAEFIKDSYYEITVKAENKMTIASSDSSYVGSMYQREELTKTFNFLSEKATTVLTKSLFQAGKASQGASSSSIAMNTTTEYFKDLPSLGEVKLMHDKLIELEGNPPSWEEIVAQRGYTSKDFGVK